MSKFFKKTTIFALIAKALLLISTEVFAKETYDVDVNHAQVIWHANHFGFSKPAGKFSDIKGKIIFDEKKPENSSVEVEIKIASLTTGLKKFDEHLLGEDIFNEAKYPTAKFISNKIQVLKRNQAKIYGELTLRGVKKNIVLDAILNKIDINPFSQKKTIGISANTKINRSDFGIDFGLPGIANQVALDIEIEANLNNEESDKLDSSKTPEKSSFKSTAKWEIIENESKIDFLVKQDKSEIRGNLKKFSGLINFDVNDLKNSQVEIKIDMTSIDIAFAQALDLVKTAPWLAVKVYPEAIFKANKFTNLAGKKQFMAHGNLTLKGKTIPVDFDFSLKEYSKVKAHLIGKAIIKRSDFDIGNKDPKKANDVANEVEINVELQANR